MRRPPWWVYLVLAPCASYLLVFCYDLIAGPETGGFLTGVQPKGLVVVGLQSQQAADRAGLRVGDVILSVNGQTGRAARQLLRRPYVGQRCEVAIERQGERKTITWTMGRKGRAYWTDPEGLIYLGDLPVAALCTWLAWLIAFRRPADGAARLGALVLAIWHVTIIHVVQFPPPGWLTAMAALPAPLAVLPITAVCLGGAAVFPVTLMFFASFPRKLVWGRWIWGLVWLPAAVAMAGIATMTSDLVYGIAAARWPMWLLGPLRTSLVAYLIAVPLVLVWNYRGLEDVNQRRRVRVLAGGFLISLVSYLPNVGIWLIPSAMSLFISYWLSPLALVGAVCSAIGPGAVAYAILRHRLFDIRVMVRQGLQYAAARRLLLALAPLFGGILAADLVLHSDQTVAQAFVQRGWLYAGLGAAALVAHAKRTSWLAALDRSFFRERYDAQRILRRVLADVRQASGLEQVAPHAISQIDAALHPEFAAILVRRAGESAFRVVAGAGPAPPEILAESKLMGLVRLLGKPIEVQQSETGWMRRQLPPEEVHWLAGARIEWIFPISLETGQVEAILALAPKRSEEPYTQEDQDLIEGVASGLALLVERPTLATGRAVPDAAASAMPQISSRYVLLRELGRGGMGAVYQARDTELERDVAIKVVRQELLANPETATRFKREARAAAGFSHPNVVTVYDFGIAEDGRAYLVMELLSGCTLRGSLREKGRFPPAHAAAILRGVCAAVESAHQRNLLHRDLKPENIFLVLSGGAEVPKVLDFGVAKPLGVSEETLTVGNTAPGQLVGTLAYMSPEQLRGGPAAPSWDLWALAVIAYEMITGAHPFSSAGAQWHAAVLAARVTPARAYLGGTAESWERFFSRALAAEPRDRPASARELLQEFENTAAV